MCKNNSYRDAISKEILRVAKTLNNGNLIPILQQRLNVDWSNVVSVHQYNQCYAVLSVTNRQQMSLTTDDDVSITICNLEANTCQKMSLLSYLSVAPCFRDPQMTIYLHWLCMYDAMHTLYNVLVKYGVFTSSFSINGNILNDQMLSGFINSGTAYMHPSALNATAFYGYGGIPVANEASTTIPFSDIVKNINADFTEQILNKLAMCLVKSGRTVETAGMKLAEEAGETIAAIFSTTSLNKEKRYKGKTSDDVVEEATDTLLCALSVIMLQDPEYTWEDVMQLMNTKLDKWIRLQGWNLQAQDMSSSIQDNIVPMIDTTTGVIYGQLNCTKGTFILDETTALGKTLKEKLMTPMHTHTGFSLGSLSHPIQESTETSRMNIIDRVYQYLIAIEEKDLTDEYLRDGCAKCDCRHPWFYANHVQCLCNEGKISALLAERIFKIMEIPEIKPLTFPDELKGPTLVGTSPESTGDKE